MAVQSVYRAWCAEHAFKVVGVAIQILGLRPLTILGNILTNFGKFGLNTRYSSIPDERSVGNMASHVFTPE